MNLSTHDFIRSVSRGDFDSTPSPFSTTTTTTTSQHHQKNQCKMLESHFAPVSVFVCVHTITSTWKSVRVKSIENNDGSLFFIACAKHIAKVGFILISKSMQQQQQQTECVHIIAKGTTCHALMFNEQKKRKFPPPPPHTTFFPSPFLFSVKKKAFCIFFLFLNPCMYMRVCVCVWVRVAKVCAQFEPKGDYSLQLFCLQAFFCSPNRRWEIKIRGRKLRSKSKNCRT